MNLSDILSEDCISLDVRACAKPQIILEMADLAMNSGMISNRDVLVNALLTRENIQTTGINQGVAIPHATAEGVRGLILSLGLSRQGIDFGSQDGKPVNLIFMLAGEPRLKTSFLGILSKISRFFRNAAFRDAVFKAKTPADILALIRAREEE